MFKPQYVSHVLIGQFADKPIHGQSSCGLINLQASHLDNILLPGTYLFLTNQMLIDFNNL